MDRKELIELELEKLDILSDKHMQYVQDTVSKLRKERCYLYLTKQDKYRLLVLRTWEIKYKVSLYYILSNLLPFWETFVSRINKKAKGKGLNVQVATLTGKKSEDILRQCISKDFPDNLNLMIWKSNEMERIYKITAKKEEIDSPVRTLERYVRHYKFKIKQETKRREKVECLFSRYPYRDNPFIERHKYGMF